MQLEIGTLVGGALLSAAPDGSAELLSRPVGAGRELEVTAMRRVRAGYAVYDAAQVGTRRRCTLTAWRRYASDAPHARLDLADPGVRAATYAATALDHESLERILAVGVDEAIGCVYVATPHAEGETLTGVVAREGALAAGEARDLVARVARAVGAIHAAGLAHGGLHPENVVVSRVDGAADVTVTGQVFALEGEPSIDERPWRAPERLPGAWMDASSGALSAPDPRADVWALGLLAFYALTGGSYWRASASEGEVSALAREMLVDPLVSPSLRAVELGVVLPLAFDVWFARCVARDIGHRFPDANTAADELVRALADRPLESAAPQLVSPGAGSLAPLALPPPMYVAQAPALPRASVDTIAATPSRASRWLAKLPFSRGPHPSWVAPAFASSALVCVTAVIITLLARSGDAPSKSASTSRATAPDDVETSSSADAPKPKTRGPWVIDPDAEPRSKTVLVTVSASTQLVDTFRSLALTLDSQRARSAFSGISLGATGSGFVLAKQKDASSAAKDAASKDAASKEPSVFIVTNRHVVAEGESVELTLDDGAKVGGDVVYSDLRHDVAVIAFTGKKPPLSAGLALSSTPVADLAPVVATGYPFLAGKPSFQIAKGEVRNRMFERSFDDVDTKEIYIQHSASIDPGSSGGPLLDGNNEVVGINTGFLPEKHDVFLALPGTVIDEAINRAIEIQDKQASAEWRIAGIQRACKELVGELASDKPRLGTFQQMISNRLIASDGLASLLIEGALTSAPSASPMDRMREAIMLRLYFAVKDRGGVTADACGDINPTDAADVVHTPVVRMTLRLDDGPSEIAWTLEHGHFRLASAPLTAPVSTTTYPGASYPRPRAPKRRY